MITHLYPRCPFDNIDEELARIQNYVVERYHPKSLDELRDIKHRIPEYISYLKWFAITDTIRIAVMHDGKVVESNYLYDSDEWKKYVQLEEQLIYKQKLSRYSPEWQAVIEKYKRRGDIS